MAFWSLACITTKLTPIIWATFETCLRAWAKSTFPIPCPALLDQRQSDPQPHKVMDNEVIV